MFRATAVAVGAVGDANRFLVLRDDSDGLELLAQELRLVTEPLSLSLSEDFKVRRDMRIAAVFGAIDAYADLRWQCQLAGGAEEPR